MEQNAAIFESLGLKSLANGLFGSNSSIKKKSCKLVKSKTGSKNDVDYEQDEGEEGMSSSDEGGVSSRAPRKKKGCYTAHISKDLEPSWTDTSIPIEETQVVQRQALTPLVDHVQQTTTQPTQLPTSSTQPHQVPNAGDHSTPVAAALGEQIRDHAPVRDIRWKAIDFGIRESIVVRVGQTFDIGDYKNDMEARETIDLKCQDLYKVWKSNLCTRYFAMKNKVADPKNHAPYPCKPEDRMFMIDNVWETKDWKGQTHRFTLESGPKSTPWTDFNKFPLGATDSLLNQWTDFNNRVFSEDLYTEASRLDAH
ncbi:hypothetical protein RHGRI_007838 [Rhododendron griersonianum]|uniref:Uncharacterized protein n=1 Tax=Rhododendron griersonianum TaxID=479676 RepID=A0AAV6KZY3_9ERIC|nr:hypothetical protein RHGRI_007838 [Rhododendron griersonianum]